MVNVTRTEYAHTAGWPSTCWTSQSRTLAAADQTVRDYLSTMYDIDATDAAIHLEPNLRGLEHDVELARSDMVQAQASVAEAADKMRKIVWRLRQDGYSVRDTATILGVATGRASQLTH